METPNSTTTVIIVSLIALIMSYIISHLFLIHTYRAYHFSVNKLNDPSEPFLDKILTKKNLKRMLILYNISILIATLIHPFIGAIVAFITVLISVKVYFEYRFAIPHCSF